MFKKDYAIGLNLTGSSLDDPDQNFYENYACGSLRNYTNYCNPALEKEFERQSMETDLAKRRAMVWDIERKLAEDVARPIIYHDVAGRLLAPLRQEHHDHGEQHLQRLAVGGRLAG